jgi:hypothetical protein
LTVGAPLPYRIRQDLAGFELGYIVKANLVHVSHFHSPALAGGRLIKLEFDDFQGAALNIPAQAVTAQAQEITSGNGLHVRV